jgi:hypothetical protein
VSGNRSFLDTTATSDPDGVAEEVRAANEPPGRLGDVITTCAQALSGFGQITAGAAPVQVGDPATILVAAALPGTAASSRTGFPRRHAASSRTRGLLLASWWTHLCTSLVHLPVPRLPWLLPLLSVAAR